MATNYTESFAKKRLEQMASRAESERSATTKKDQVDAKLQGKKKTVNEQLATTSGVTKEYDAAKKLYGLAYQANQETWALKSAYQRTKNYDPVSIEAGHSRRYGSGTTTGDDANKEAQKAEWEAYASQSRQKRIQDIMQKTPVMLETQNGMVENKAFTYWDDKLTGELLRQSDMESAQKPAQARSVAAAYDEKWRNVFTQTAEKAGGTVVLRKAIENYIGAENTISAGTGNAAAVTQLEDARTKLQSYGLTQEEIDELAYWVRMQNNEEQAEIFAEQTAQDAQEHPVLYSLASVPANLASGIGIGDLALQKLLNSIKGSDRPLDFNSGAQGLGQASSTIRETVASNMGAVGSFLYQTGMSMLDSAGVALLSMVGMPAAGALLGGSAATQAAQEAKARGLSDDKALLFGLASGAAEMIFESVSLERLKALQPAELTGAVKQQLMTLLKNTAKQGFTEGSEEFFTTVANTISDAIISGDLSDYNLSVQKYMEGGKSREEAEQLATQDWWKSAGLDFLGGAISGGVMGAATTGIKTGVDAIQNRSQNAQTQDTQVQADQTQDTQAQDTAQDVPQPGNTVLQSAVEQAGTPGGVTNSTVKNILNDADAVSILQQEAGLTLKDGMTQSERRAAVKEAVATLAQKGWDTNALSNDGTRLTQDAAQVQQNAENAAEVQRPQSNTERVARQWTQEDAERRAMIQAEREADATRRKTYASEAGNDFGLVYDSYVRDAVTGSGENAGLNAETADRINAVAKALNLRVQYVDSVEGGIANAQISGDTVLIDKNTDSPDMFVIGHEVTHRMQELAPEAYQAFRGVVAQDSNFAYQVVDTMQLYEKYGKTITREAAMDEVAADYAGKLMEDGRLLDEFIEKHRENRTLLEKLRDAIRSVIAKLTGAEKRKAQTAEGKLTAALEKASEAAKQGNKNTANEGGGVKYALRAFEDGTRFVDVQDFDTIFKVGDEYYKGTINIVPVEKGLLLKDITQIENITQDISSSYGSNPKSTFLRDASISRVLENGENVNRKFSLKPDNVGRELTAGQYDGANVYVAFESNQFKNVTNQNPTSDADIRFSLKGRNRLGIEVYETSEEVMKMSAAQRISKYLDIMENEYAGRTARFSRNGHTYYAEFDSSDLRKPVYGDKRSTPGGKKALIRAAADGDFFDLVENAEYERSSKDTKAHKNTDYFDYFIKTVQIDGKVYDLLADVKKQYNKDNAYVYTLWLVENKNIGAYPAAATDVAVKGAEQAPIVEPSVPQNGTEVKTDFSLKGGESARTNAKLRQENDLLRERVDYWKSQTRRTTQTTTNARAVALTAKQLIRDYGAELAVEDIQGELQGLYDYLARGHDGSNELTYEDAYRRAEGIARQLVQSAMEADDLYYDQLTEGDTSTAGVEQAVSGVANEVMERFFDLPQTKKTFADRQAEKLEAAKAKGKQQVQEVREQRDRKLAELRSENRERVQKAIARERENANRKIGKLKEKQTAKDTAEKERRTAAELREKITRHAGELSKKLLSPTDKRHIPEELRGAVANLLENINQESKNGRATKRSEAFAELKKAYSEIVKSDTNGEIVIDPALLGDAASGFSGLFDQVIEMGDTPLLNLNAAQLQTVWQTVKAVEHAVTQAGKVLSNAKFTQTQEWATQFRQDTMQKKAKKSGTFSRAVTDLMDPYTYFSQFGDSGKAVYRMLRDAQDTARVRLDEIVREVGKIVDTKAVREARKQRHEITLESGEKVTLTSAQLMGLYNLSKREQAQAHLLKGGIVQPEIERDGKQKHIAHGTEALRVTQNDLTAMLSLLTDGEKKIAEALQKLTSDTLAAWGNEASMKAYGYRKFGEANYWPIHSWKGVLKSTTENSGQNVRSIANIGLAKATTPHANNAVDLYDVFMDFADHAADMIDYSTWLLPMEDANRLFNFRFVGDTKTTSVKSLIDRTGGEGSQQYWRNLMDNIQNGIGSSGGAFSQLTNRLTGNVKGSSVGYNIRVVMQQPTAFFRANAVLSPVDLARGMVRATQLKDENGKSMSGWEKAQKYAPIARIKDVGGFDQSTLRSVASELYGVKNVRDWFSDASGWAAGKADASTWGKLWNACEWATVRTHKNLAPGSEAFYRQVAETFTDMIDQTQVVDGILQRAQIMRNADGVVKQMTSFMGEPLKSLNLLMRSWNGFTRETDTAKRKAAKGTMYRAAAALFVTDVINALVQSIADAWRDDDEDKNFFERYFTALTGVTGDEEGIGETAKNIVMNGNLVDNINPLTRIPAVKDAWSLLQGYSVDRMDVSAISDLLDAGTAFVKNIGGDGSKTQAYAVKQLLTAGSKVFGLSEANLSRDIWGVARSIATETGSVWAQYLMEKAIYNVSSESNKGRYMDILYRALEQGDTEVYRKIAAELIDDEANGITGKSIETAMKSRYKKAAEKDVNYSLPEGGAEIIRKLPEYESEDTGDEFDVGDLGADAYLAYSEQRAEDYTDAANELPGYAYFNGLDDEWQTRALGYADKIAHEYALADASDGEHEITTKWIKYAEEAEKKGISNAQYVLFHVAYTTSETERDANNKPIKGKEKSDKVRKWLTSQGLTRSQQEYLWSTVYSGKY